MNNIEKLKLYLDDYYRSVLKPKTLIEGGNKYLEEIEKERETIENFIDYIYNN